MYIHVSNTLKGLFLQLELLSLELNFGAGENSYGPYRPPGPWRRRNLWRG